MSSTPLLTVITGPTASGKSALAVETALRLDTEVISADSRQIYRGIPIVTAVPTADEMQGVRHHLLETLPLDAYYSASLFEQDALRIAGQLMEHNGHAVVCGGSMLYIDALCNGIDELPTVPDDIRSGLLAEHAANGDEWLRKELQRLDADYYATVDLSNTKRVFHAVEIIRASGKTYTELRTGRRRIRPFRIRKIMIDRQREELFGRINARVDAMVRLGLEQEARSVYNLRHLNSINTVGLKEMFAWFDGTMKRDEAIERIKKNTRVYAKKQMTWWNRDADITHLDGTDPAIVDKILAL